MSAIEFLREQMHARGDDPALIWRDQQLSYRAVLRQIEDETRRLNLAGIQAGDVASLVTDYSPGGIATLLALAELRAISVPLSAAPEERIRHCESVAEAQWRIDAQGEGAGGLERVSQRGDHPLLGQIRSSGNPGLVLFSSGSSGASKATLHDLTRLFSKFRRPGRPYRTLAFYQLDHIGGLDILVGTLHAGGCLVVPQGRSPDQVLAAVERHGVELLPVSPTFLHLMLLSESHLRHRLDSLRVIAFGAEPMPESTRKRLKEELPQARLVETYGLSELGTLRARPRAAGSPWLELSAQGQSYRVVDGVLQILTETSMLGYLNAPSPFTEDGWFITGDEVEEEEGFLRILGRKAEIVNVGGEKVHPSVVENVLLEVEGVLEATAFAEPNPITGSVVCARVCVAGDAPEKELARRLKAHCRKRLAPYQVPVRIYIDRDPQHGTRWKKERWRVVQETLPTASSGTDESLERLG